MVCQPWPSDVGFQGIDELEAARTSAYAEKWTCPVEVAINGCGDAGDGSPLEDTAFESLDEHLTKSKTWKYYLAPCFQVVHPDFSNLQRPMAQHLSCIFSWKPYSLLERGRDRPGNLQIRITGKCYYGEGKAKFNLKQ